MIEKLVNIVFKIGVLLIGMGFLVVCFFHSQNGRFHKVGDDKDNPLFCQILDTRTGIIYSSLTEKGEKLRFFSINTTNGKLKLYDTDRSGEWKSLAPKAPEAPSAEDLKGKK